MDNFNPNKKEQQQQQQQSFNHSSICNPMSRSFSIDYMDELFKQVIRDDAADDHHHHLTHPPPSQILSAADSVVFSNDDRKGFPADASSPDLALQYRYPDNINRFSSCGGMTTNPLWTQNLNPKNSVVTTIMDAQSSICVASPTSDTKPKRQDTNVIGVTSDEEQSDYDDTEIEAGQCEQSNNPVDVKRMKRMVSNRESARRSRQRRQAQLTELEQQVEQLRVEYSTLFKQLTNASHQFKDASTNNRVLKSEVEALRAKVKLAEDMVARGSLTSSVSHLLQNHLATPQMFNGQNMSRMGNVSPTINVRGDDHAGLPLPGQHMMVGLGGNNPDIFNGNSDGGSCITDIWQH